ncbi:MAG TPA: PQQ-dependent dehydrogenase, methanol/ethanol family [Gammaproteobacteria bacterium]|nr:PQQ-dependent dehydrogenase, methanol/ethanol family [Gammaproteobacteria bacterium]
MRFRFPEAALAAVLSLAAGCDPDAEPPDPGPDTPAPIVDDAAATDTGTGVDDSALIAAGERNDAWLTYGRDYAETRFSPLDQIDAETVGRLSVVWHYDTGSLRGLEATPLVHDGVLYATTSWSNVFAVDAVTGRELWRWDAEADRIRGARACCDVVNRGVAIYDGNIYVGVVDGRLVALDAATGTPVWQVQTTPRDLPYTITGAPRIADGKVIIGNGGAEYGVRGYVSAYDAATGELAWRFYTVPGNPAQGFESEAMARAAETWTGEWWALGGGGTVWDSIVYDPNARLVYIGTGNGTPWNRNIRSPGGGDNLYLSSIVALDVDNGDLVWHYQTTPGDHWDYTAVQPLMLADLVIEGREREVIMQAPKNGFFYVLDRMTGELVSAEPFIGITWAKGVDKSTGRPIETMQARYGDALTDIAPGPGGGHNWHPMSFNPATGLVYIPAQQSTFVYSNDRDFVPTSRENLGVAIPPAPEAEVRLASAYEPGTGTPLPGAHALLAWDPIAEEARWLVDHGAAPGGGTLTTAGNLVFQGRGDGRFAAFAADDGENLWEVDLGNGILAPPVTYEIDGVQYVSVLVGWGSTAGLFGTYPSDQYKAEGRLYTFALDADPDFEPVRGIARPELTEIVFEASDEAIARGAALYGKRCYTCHGLGAVSGGQIADLRYSTAATYDALDSIVRGGAYQQLGMPIFDFFTEADTAAIRAYLLSQRAALIAGR